MTPRVRRCLLASEVAFVVFALVALAWTRLALIREFDESVAERLHAWARSSPSIPETFLAITYLGSARFLFWFAIVIAGALIVLRRWRLAFAFCGAQLIAVMLISQAKLFFERPRPQFNGFFVREGGYSFPSGHALGSMAAFGMLAYLCAILIARPSVRRCAILICCILIALIGGSRPVLGVHYFCDVLGGFALGAAWLMLVIAVIEDVRAHDVRCSLSNGGAGQ